jgi:catechol 2,3-dioxygenase-like lactoylglutathione lyase family enzyme
MSEVSIWSAEPQLFVSDMARALHFYADRLGFGAAFTHGVPPFYAQIFRGGTRLNMRHVNGAVFDAQFRARTSDALSATITVDDPGRLFAEFQQSGVAFHQLLKCEAWARKPSSCETWATIW